MLAPPYLIERIEDSNGEILYQNIVSQRISIPDPGAAAAVRKTLEVAANLVLEQGQSLMTGLLLEKQVLIKVLERLGLSVLFHNIPHLCGLDLPKNSFR